MAQIWSNEEDTLLRELVGNFWIPVDPQIPWSHIAQTMQTHFQVRQYNADNVSHHWKHDLRPRLLAQAEVADAKRQVELEDELRGLNLGHHVPSMVETDDDSAGRKDDYLRPPVHTPSVGKDLFSTYDFDSKRMPEHGAKVPDIDNLGPVRQRTLKRGADGKWKSVARDIADKPSVEEDHTALRVSGYGYSSHLL
jgi:hypothetical protein